MMYGKLKHECEPQLDHELNLSLILSLEHEHHM